MEVVVKVLVEVVAGGREGDLSGGLWIQGLEVLEVVGSGGWSYGGGGGGLKGIEGVK